MRPLVLSVLLGILRLSSCALEPTFIRCCGLGENWAVQDLKCNNFPAPVAGVPPEQQSICLSAVEICCLRKHREKQCEEGKGAARSGTDCLVASSPGGEYLKDCCEACKLGLISGSMGMECAFQNFEFGPPWDKAYQACCVEAQPSTTSTSPASTVTTATQDRKTTIIPTPALDSLCDLLPGELCAHICVPIPGSFRCMCREGFTLMADGKSCQHDGLPDRCKMNNPCAHKCLDTGVAIECSCFPGYELAADERSCNDIDECAQEIFTCASDEQVCHNEPGSYSCVNPDGSVAKPSSTTTGPQMTNNEFETGKCPKGYKFNLQSQVCDDIDECTLNVASCGSNSVCQNTIGSFMCVRTPIESCPPGYRFDHIQQICSDIDECSEGLDDCQGERNFCVNTEGNYTCQQQLDTKCPAGYKYNKAAANCEDVDECAENLHGCVPETETCRNTVGAYECDMKCDAGYQYSLAHRTCVDVDECHTGQHDCKTGRCLNTIGSYTCVNEPKATCPAGYKPTSEVGKQCEDVDECRENIDSCDRNTETCINDIGSFRCEPIEIPGTSDSVANESRSTGSRPILTGMNNEDNQVDICRPGYSYSYTRKACLDVNECLMDLHNCSVRDGEECVNMPGSFMCKLSPKCPQGYKYNKITLKCEDEDECALGTHNCNPSERCVNNAGSFWCNPSCRAGYKIDPQNPQNCVDIDECQEIVDTCIRNKERCKNTDGSFICESIFDCPTGYRRAQNDLCMDVDECAEDRHNCIRGVQLCVNTLGGYNCVDRVDQRTACGHGYRYNTTTLNCQDVNECTEKSHNCDSLTQFCINTHGGFQCQTRHRIPIQTCPAGFRMDKDSRTCVDVNECVENHPKCSNGEDCLNTIGSFQCIRKIRADTSVPTTTSSSTSLGPNSNQQCPAGFRFNTQVGRCFDVNECEEGTHVCNLEACINEPGGYRCAPKSSTESSQCQTGFQFEQATGTCIDIDECDENLDPPCDSNQDCRNTQGGFLCVCKTGFQLDPILRACVDVNECQVNKHDCLPSQRCDNTIGSYHCIRFTSCGTGYTLNAQTGQCEDDDECVLGTDNCRHLGPMWQCRNTLGSFRCERKRCDGKQVLLSNGECKPLECPTGYEASQQGQCIDVNECERNNPCRRNQRCLNTGGSYRCINFLNCGGGFELNDAGNQCVDIDECARSTHDCRQGQLCINRVGGYICQCPGGHTLNEQKDCVDIDECTRFQGQVCAINSKCFNTVGSYRCLCNDGFRQDPKGGNSCIDVDECAESPGLCQQNCINIWGSYRCSCNQGFTLQHDNRSCHDIDECEQFKDRNLCVGLCVNQAGSYACQCPEGYRLGTDGRTCQDVDECLGGNVCHNPNEVCLNTRGSYRCNVISCPQNFIKDPEHKKYYLRENSIMCKRECKPYDSACLMNNTNTITYQFISIPTVRILHSPMVLTRIRAVTLGSGWAFKVHFEVIFGNEEHYFDFQQGTKLGALRLTRPVFGPKHFLVKIQMKVFTTRNFLSAKHWAYVDIDVSNYEF
ncbi:fibrillin-2 isoform X2 [Periplaneta americana]|uniref:fibrillin-2 isoform X2 n=1 Tax=Periplaneta americana TaxID=6978 RepID=UPI0037E78DED